MCPMCIAASGEAGHAVTMGQREATEISTSSKARCVHALGRTVLRVALSCTLACNAASGGLAGGETGDFGSIAEPDPCENRENARHIDEAEAHRLGFGPTLDLLTREFQAPFSWKPRPSDNGQPAKGYERATSVSGSTTVVGLEQSVDEEESCEDRLIVRLDTTLNTEDGAVAFRGPMWVYVRRDEVAPTGWATVDLASVEGSLQLFPNPYPEPTVSRFNVDLAFWPADVRGAVSASVIDAANGGDTWNFLYQPIQGVWPPDHCSFASRPLQPGDPSSKPDGESVAELLLSLQEKLDATPGLATWPDGKKTMVRTRLGEPNTICQELASSHSKAVALTFDLPLETATSDGRMRLAHQATAYVEFDEEGTRMTTMFSSDKNAPVSSQQFEEIASVSGIDFGRLTDLVWSLELWPETRGQLIVRDPSRTETWVLEWSY